MRSARALLAEIGDMDTTEEQKDKIVLLILLCVNVVEAFTNIFFVIKARETGDKDLIREIDKELGINNEKGISIKSKLNRWPPKIVHKSVNWSSGYGLEFDNLRCIRNRLMHFTSSHETASFGGIEFTGLSDTSVYDNLDKMAAVKAMSTVLGFIGHLLTISGTPAKDISNEIHSWLGVLPA